MRSGDDNDFDELARTARAAITEVLAAIEGVRVARRNAGDKELSEAGEYLALKALTEAEERLTAAVMADDFVACQRQFLNVLVEFLEGGR
ncbi:MAG: hypothetical protein ACK4FR_02830 [Tabrizicola sp.]